MNQMEWLKIGHKNNFNSIQLIFNKITIILATSKVFIQQLQANEEISVEYNVPNAIKQCGNTK